MFLGRHVDVIAALFQIDSKTAETVRNHSQILIGNILDGDGALGQGGHSDEGSDFDHVRKDGVSRSMQSPDSPDPEEIGTDAADVRSHCAQQSAQLLDIRFTGSVVDGGLPFCQRGGHQDVRSTGHRGFVKEHVAALEMPAFRDAQTERPERVIIFDGSSKIQHSLNMCVHAAPSYLVSARFREICHSEAGEQRSDDHHGTAEVGAFADKFFAEDVVPVDRVSLE